MIRLAAPVPVVVRKRKHDGRLRTEWDGELVAAVGDHWRVVHHDGRRHARRPAVPRHAADVPPRALHWIGLDVPLTILCVFDRAGRFQEAKCDAALPARELDGALEFVDLDVDLLVDRELRTRLRDEEVYARNAPLLGYTPATRAAVEAGIALARELVARREPPFDGSAEALAAALAASAPVEARGGGKQGRGG